MQTIEHPGRPRRAPFGAARAFGGGWVLVALALCGALRLPAHAAAEPAPPPAGSPILKGRITDENGRPVAGVKVRIWTGFATRWQVGETTTDAQGAYRFESVKSGRVLDEKTKRWDAFVGITLEHPTHVSADGEAWWDERIPGVAGQEHTRDFALVRGGAIAGRMVDARTGKPRAGFAIRCVRGKAHPAYATTDAKGEFAAGALFPGEYVVEANQDRFPDVTLGRVVVRAGEAARLTVRLAEIVGVEIRRCLLVPDALGTDVLLKMQELRKQGVAIGEDAARLDEGLKQLETRGFGQMGSAPRLALFAGSTGRVGTGSQPVQEEPRPAYWMEVTPRLQGEMVDADVRVFIGTREGVTNSGRLVEESVRVRPGETAALWMRTTKEMPGDVVVLFRFTVTQPPEEPAPGAADPK